MGKKVFTTTQVGRICGVTQQTVIKWIDSKQIEGFRLPNSRDRRVTRTALLKFMKGHNIPTDVLDEKAARRILVVDDEESILEFFREVFGRDEDTDVRTVGRGFDAGVFSEFRPHIVFLDIMLPDIDGREVCKLIREGSGGEDAVIIAISGYSETLNIDELEKMGFDEYLAKPFDAATIRETFEKYIDSNGKQIME